MTTAGTTVALTKGANVNLSKHIPGLRKIMVGLGWDVRMGTVGDDFDLDASAFMLGADGKVLSPMHFVFYNNKNSPDGSIVHTGDNLTGAGDGDDESLIVDLSKVPADCQNIAFVVTIHMFAERRQNFGQVSNAFIRIVNEDGGAEIARYDLTEDASTETGMIFGELYRRDGEWKFRAVGQGYANGLAGLVTHYGLSAS